MKQKQQDTLDTIKLFMEISGYKYDRAKVKRILELAQQNCTQQMIADDMDIGDEELTNYLIVMRACRLIGMLGEDG